MNTTRLASWLLIVGPIGMLAVWMFLSPMLIGDVAEGLTSSEEALAYLQLNLDNEVISLVLDMIGGLCFIGMFAGFALLARSLQAGGANVAALCAYIFPAMIAIAVAGFGLSIEALNHFKDGELAEASALMVASDGLFGAMPTMWGLGTILLGLGITRDEGATPAIMGWILALFGVGMLSGTFISFSNSPIGMVVWLGMSIATVATGVTTLRKAD